MSFNYNNEVLDLLLKKTLGSAYTSSDLVAGQETPVLPKIQNSQIFTNRITDKNSSNFTWSSPVQLGGVGANITCLTTSTQVNIVSYNGNKYVFNNGTSYNSNEKFGLYATTYTFSNVPSGHPIAILNSGNTNISYTGDASKKFSKTVTGTTNDGTYDFYYGDVTVTVTGDFGNVSVYCYYHGYMGGENLLTYSVGCQNPGGSLGTVSYLDVVTGETSTFQYIKKYESIPMSVVPGTDNRAWKPTDSVMQKKFENVILGKPNFSFSITTDITNYTTIYSTNSLYKPVINNGVLVFLGNSVPSSTTAISMKEVFIYEGAFGTTTGMLISDISNVNISSPQDGQPLIYDNSTQKWIGGTVGKDFIPISTLETIDDVSLNGLAVGDTIGYDGFKWVPKQVPTDLSDISDVNLTSAVAGQSIIYNATTGVWGPGNVQTPLVELSDVSDVKIDVGGPYDGQGLVWKDASGCWTAKDIQTPLNNLGDISGIDISGIVPGQTIVLDISGIFVPKTIGEVIENLSDLNDVDVSNLADQIPQWTQKNRLEASDAQASDNFGFSSAIDISYALVGAPNANSSNNADVGKAYLYIKNFFLGTYSEDQILMSTIDNGNMNFGHSVAIGRTVLMIGAPNHSYSVSGNLKEKAGTVFFYNYSPILEKWGTVNGSIYNENSKIQPGNANDQFGFSMDMDVSSNICIIGSPQKLANGNGKADIYENISGTWTFKKSLTASDGAAGDNFGVSVTINDEGTFAFVGADNQDSAKGAVYVFKKNHPNAGDWGQYQKIVSLDQRINSYFGKSVSVHLNTLLIGSPNGGNFAGAVYEVTYSTGTGKWGSQSGSYEYPSSDKIQALDASANDQYGYSVSVYDNFGIIGSKSTDMSGNVDTGSAYIIINTGEGYWEESKQINPNDLDVQDEYGISVGLFGRTAVVGSWLSEGDQGGDPAHAGSAYIFNLPNPEGGTKALIYDTDYNRWKVGSVAPSDDAVVTKLGLLDDVDVTTIVNNNVLSYDDASGNWKPATMGSLITIGDISDVDLSGVATGKAIIWDASLNKWIVGDAGGGSASGVTSTNIQPTVDSEGEPLTGGKLYYDTSWNSFHGRTAEGWQELLLSNTNMLFGAPARLKKAPYLETLLNIFPDRLEFCWENPPQYVTGFTASNASDYVGGELFLPVINHIKFEFYKTSDGETFGSTSRGTITVGGKSGIGRGNINGNTTQTLTNASGSNKITNKLVLFTTGSSAAVGVADGWTNLNTESSGSYEYDFVHVDASGNQVYYFNPRSSDFSIIAQTPYSFRMWAENSITPHNYRVWSGITTKIVGEPTAIKIADPGQKNGFYAEIVQDGLGHHKIKVVVPKEALTATGVEVTQSETGVDNSVFFQAFEVQFQTVNAVTNENTETSSITGWTSIDDVSFDEGNPFGELDNYSTIVATTPLQNKNSFTTVFKHISLNEFDNKFYRFRVRAKNQVGTTFGPWTTDYYTVRFTRPEKMAWNNPPLFLSKLGDPDKWFITLNWSDTKSSVGGVTSGDADWTNSNLSIAQYRLTRSTNNGSSYTIVDTNDYLSLDGNKRMKYYECDTLYSIFDAFTENTSGWYTSEISASNKALLLDTTKYTYTNCFDGDSDNIIYYRRIQNNKCEVYTSYIDVPSELTYAFVNKNVFAGGMAMLILDLNNNHIFSYKFNSETGANSASTSIAEVTLNKGRYKLFVYAFGEGYYNNLWSSIFVWTSETFATDSTPTWSYNGNHAYLNWVPTSGYYHNGRNYTRWKLIRNDYNNSSDLKFFAADNLTSFFRNTDTSKLSYDYCVASASDSTQKWTNPQYKFKIEARNFLFGTSNSDANAWSTISEASVSLIPTTPATPTHLQLKFYEQSQKNTTSNPASYYSSDPWTAPSNDYVLYQWDINFDNTGSGYGTTDYNGVTIGTANKLTPEQYQLEYLVGKANISGSTLRLVTTVEGTTNVDQYRNTELLVGDKYRLGTGTTIYTVSSVSNDLKKHILNHTGSETGIVEIYKVLYINATDKNLPGANPYYPRVYNVEEYVGGGYGLSSLLRNASWSFTVKAKNYFVSTASSGFSSAGPYGLDPPTNVRFIAGTTIDISNSKIILSFNEPDTSSKSAYTNNPEIFHTQDAIDYKSFAVEPFINSVSQGNRSIYTTAQSATRREVAYDHLLTSNSSALSGMSEGAGSTIKYKFKAENVLDTVYGDSVESTFKILRPAPTNMDAIPLFEWQTDGTNNIKLTLRRSNGGLAPNTSNSNTGSTICPVTSLSSTGGDTATLKATTDELQWEVKASTALSNGITASFSDYAGTGFTNQDYVVANIGTLALNVEYEIFFRLKNRYVSTWKESTSPKVMLKVPNAPTGLSVVLDIGDDNAGHNNKLTLSWTKPTEPGLFYQHDGAADNAALVAHPNSPYIEKYEISFTDGSTEYRFLTTLGSASAEAPTSFEFTGSISSSNGGGTFYLMPDVNYTNFKIRAYNVRANTSAGAYSGTVTPTYVSRTRATANIGVPYTIGDVDQTIDTGYRPSFNLGGNYTYGNQVIYKDGTAVQYTVKNWNTVNTESSNCSNVLLNRYFNKPGASDGICNLWISANANGDGPSNYTVNSFSNNITPSSGSGFAATTANNWGIIQFGTAVADLFPSGYNNTGQWYKTTNFKYTLYRNNVKGSASGFPFSMNFHFRYLNSSGAQANSVTSQFCYNQDFDEVNEASSISGTPTVSYTPYYVTGIPTLYPGKTQTVRAAFVIDNKSEHYVNSDYISRVNLIDKDATGNFNGIMNYMNHEWKRKRTEHTNSSGTLWTADAGYQAIGGPNLATTSTSGITTSNTIVCRILHKNIYGDGTSQNVEISSGKDHYFIYDKKTYDLIDNNDSLSHVHLTFPNQAAAHQGTSTSFTSSYRKITILNPPNAKFNPSTETTNLHISLDSGSYFNNSSASNTTGTLSEWNYGAFDGQTSPDSTHNCLAMYDGLFHSPASLKSSSYLPSTNLAHYHSSLSTLYTYYAQDNTAASDYLGSPSSHYGDNYHWAFYKFVAQNGPNSAVTPIESQIFLANGNDDNNTNITFSDLLSTEGTTSVSSSPKVKVCIKSLFSENGTLWETSGWNQVVNGQTSTDVQSPTQSELNGDLTISPSGSTNTNAWTDSIGKKKIVDYSELGNSGQVPSDSTWKSNCRPLPFKHGTSKMNKNVKTWHIIAVGIRNDVSRYIGNVYISRKYDDSL